MYLMFLVNCGSLFTATMLSPAGMKPMKSSNIWNSVFIVCIMRILEFTTCFFLSMLNRLGLFLEF